MLILLLCGHDFQCFSVSLVLSPKTEVCGLSLAACEDGPVTAHQTIVLLSKNVASKPSLRWP